MAGAWARAVLAAAAAVPAAVSRQHVRWRERVRLHDEGQPQAAGGGPAAGAEGALRRPQQILDRPGGHRRQDEVLPAALGRLEGLFDDAAVVHGLLLDAGDRLERQTLPATAGLMGARGDDVTHMSRVRDDLQRPCTLADTHRRRDHHIRRGHRQDTCLPGGGRPGWAARCTRARRSAATREGDGHGEGYKSVQGVAKAMSAMSSAHVLRGWLAAQTSATMEFAASTCCSAGAANRTTSEPREAGGKHRICRPQREQDTATA